MNNLFNKYLDDITNKNYDSDIYKIFLNTMDACYIDNTDSKRMVIDYIAGMTDDYFVKKIKEISVNTK